MKAKLLHQLLRKSVSFNFDDKCRHAFVNLKKELVAYPVLRLYDPSAETDYTQTHAHKDSVQYYCKSSRINSGLQSRTIVAQTARPKPNIIIMIGNVSGSESGGAFIYMARISKS